MEEKEIKCLCGKIYTEAKLKSHIRKCPPFLKRFKIFDFKIARILEEYFLKDDNIFLVRFLFKRYLKLIDHKIKKKYKNEEIFNIKCKKENNQDLNNISLSSYKTEILYSPKRFYKKSHNKNKNENIIDLNEIKEDNSLYINKIKKTSFFYKKPINRINEEKNSPLKDNKKKSTFKNIFSFLSHKQEKCKFCYNNLDKKGICLNEKCKELAFISCPKRLICGHYCLGIIDEIACPPCLDNNCKKYGGLFNQNRDTCCQICLKKLSESPIVSLSCNHYVHYFCINKKLTDGKNLNGKKINFDYMKCPVCDSIYECPSVPFIQQAIEENKKFHLKIRNMIEQRLIYKKIDSNKDPFDLFIFYICFKCHEPYYAGLNEDNNDNKKEEKFFGNEEDCICGKDSFLNNAKGESFCNKHGYDYIEYKCKYCCKVASRFCSQMHFCEECYRNKSNNFNFDLGEIKECNKDLCEFRGMHAPNGIEYCLGCFICRFESIQHEYPIFEE